MGCEIKNDGPVYVVVCSRGAKGNPKKCKFCKVRWASKLCDFPVDGKTCDAAMCDKCATSIYYRKNADYCPDHKDKWDGHRFMKSMQGLQQSCALCGRPEGWHK